jgi:hypothetical protein
VIGDFISNLPKTPTPRYPTRLGAMPKEKPDGYQTPSLLYGVRDADTTSTLLPGVEELSG